MHVFRSEEPNEQVKKLECELHGERELVRYYEGEAMRAQKRLASFFLVLALAMVSCVVGTAYVMARGSTMMVDNTKDPAAGLFLDNQCLGGTFCQIDTYVNEAKIATTVCITRRAE